MKKYDVYGLGNALVDIEYEVKPEQLQILGIDKGVMTLVDEDRQAKIVSQLNGAERNKGSGGSAANTIIAVSQFGGNAFYSCRVADDEMGHFYVDDLIHGGVTTNIHPARMGTGVTGKCLVFVTPDADRTMNTYLGVSAELSEDEVDESGIEDSKYLYLEGYLVTGERTRAATVYARHVAKKTDTKVALSLSDPNMVKFFKDGLLEMIGDGVDLLFANEQEALGMTGAGNLNDAINQLRTIAGEVVVTLGPKGACICDSDGLIEIAPVKVKAVDTVGAGDMFAGAYLYGITHGMSRQQAGNLASIAAAKLITHFGPRLKAEETKALLNGFLNR